MQFVIGDMQICNRRMFQSISDQNLNTLLFQSQISFINQQKPLMSYSNVVFQQNIGRAVNRDQVQKQRIDDRVGFQTRFQTAGSLIFNPPPNSTLNVTDKQRFNKNHEQNDRIARQHERDKKDHFYQARLNKRMERDEQRWQKQAKLEQFEQKKIQKKNVVLTENRRNTNGIGYNPISHEYEISQRGKKLEVHDEGKQVNRYVRSKNLIEKNISPFNIITGESNQKIKQNVPEKFRQRVEEKYTAKIEREKVKYEPIRDKYDYLDDQ